VRPAFKWMVSSESARQGAQATPSACLATGLNEAEDGMELDPVRCDAGLPVQEIEEADTGDRRRSAQVA